MATYDERTGVYSTIDPSEIEEYMKKVLGECNREIKKEEDKNGDDHNK